MMWFKDWKEAVTKRTKNNNKFINSKYINNNKLKLRRTFGYKFMMLDCQMNGLAVKMSTFRSKVFEIGVYDWKVYFTIWFNILLSENLIVPVC